jgi:hypothetical protein
MRIDSITISSYKRALSNQLPSYSTVSYSTLSAANRISLITQKLSFLTPARSKHPVYTHSSTALIASLPISSRTIIPAGFSFMSVSNIRDQTGLLAAVHCINWNLKPSHDVTRTIIISCQIFKKKMNLLKNSCEFQIPSRLLSGS